MLSCWSHWQKIRKTAVWLLSLSFCLTFAACAGKQVKSVESVPSDVPHGTLTIDRNDTGIWAYVDGQTVNFPTWFKPKSFHYAPASFRLSPGQHNIKVGYYTSFKNNPGPGETKVTVTETSTRKPLERVIDIQEGKETVVNLERIYGSIRIVIAQQKTAVTPLKK